MQKIIFKNKNKIMILNFILIVIGFLFKLVFDIILIFNITLIIASIFGTIPIAIQAYQALRVRVISIDVLVTIAVIGAFVIKAYEESAIVTFLFLFGSYLEARTLNKTRSAIKELTMMAPESATIINEDGSFNDVLIDEVNVNDLLLVKTGSKVPVDGLVLNGSGYVNEASITGESIPVKKKDSDLVYAGTILDNGTLTIKALKVGEDTVFGKIIELVEEAQDSKSKAEKFIDKFSNYYTPFVLLLGIIVFIITKDVALAVTILVLGCPGALVIGVPVSNVSGIGNGARHGILLKGSEVISDFSKVDTIVFDKTGTLTIGKPVVSDVTYFNDERKASEYLVKVEETSNHPLAKAIIEHYNIKSDLVLKANKVINGAGIIGTINDDLVLVGNELLLSEYLVNLTDEMKVVIDEYKTKGNSVVITVINYQVYSILGIKDQLRPNIKKDLNKLSKYGVKELVLLSGDNQKAVDVVKQELELTKAFGEMLPADKAEYIKNLQKSGKIVAFVGDGINDSPSLATANIGIAMGSGTDVAIETSNVVLMNSNFEKLTHALGLTKKIVSNMRQNIIIALSVVLVLILSLLFSDWMNMSIGMLLHEFSILVVILNGMRLLSFKTKN